ncbi:MAG: hypothetical protein AAGF07_05130 [Patescibacteria group bacterium]
MLTKLLAGVILFGTLTLGGSALAETKVNTNTSVSVKNAQLTAASAYYGSTSKDGVSVKNSASVVGVTGGDNDGLNVKAFADAKKGEASMTTKKGKGMTFEGPVPEIMLPGVGGK